MIKNLKCWLIKFQNRIFLLLDRNIISLFHKYLLSTFHLSGTVLSPGGKGLKKTGRHGLHFHGIYVQALNQLLQMWWFLREEYAITACDGEAYQKPWWLEQTSTLRGAGQVRVSHEKAGKRRDKAKETGRATFKVRASMAQLRNWTRSDWRIELQV